MKKMKIETAEIVPGLGGGYDPGAQARELADMPLGGKPTYRKRGIVHALEDGALANLGNLELAPKMASAITTYDKGIRDDEVFNAGLRKQERDIEKEDNNKDDNNDDAQADTLEDEREARAALADALFKYQH